ncbi:MAG: hypothetical protein IJZ92_04370 [Bacteroidaceae bacterium]|nr:hypothetical protein [Bacteroidaceae bacterium]
MTYEEAIRLREKFYAGATTPDEEQEWLQWLCADASGEEWAADREVILALTVPADVEAPAGLENRIAARLQADAEHPQRSSVVRRPLWRRFTAVSGIAACFGALALGAYLWQAGAPTVYEDTCRNSYEAAVETENTLLFLSEQLCYSLETSDELGMPEP